MYCSNFIINRLYEWNSNFHNLLDFLAPVGFECRLSTMPKLVWFEFSWFLIRLFSCWLFWDNPFFFFSFQIIWCNQFTFGFKFHFKCDIVTKEVFTKHENGHCLKHVASLKILLQVNTKSIFCLIRNSGYFDKILIFKGHEIIDTWLSFHGFWCPKSFWVSFWLFWNVNHYIGQLYWRTKIYLHNMTNDHYLKHVKKKKKQETALYMGNKHHLCSRQLTPWTPPPQGSSKIRHRLNI